MSMQRINTDQHPRINMGVLKHQCSAIGEEAQRWLCASVAHSADPSRLLPLGAQFTSRRLYIG